MTMKQLVAALAARAPGTFEGAVADLRAQVGGDGTLRDTAVFLADDCRTVLLFANYSDDAATVSSSFVLPDVIAEDDFNSNAVREAIDGQLSDNH
jgi:hypothetical protein